MGVESIEVEYSILWSEESSDNRIESLFIDLIGTLIGKLWMAIILTQFRSNSSSFVRKEFVSLGICKNLA